MKVIFTEVVALFSKKDRNMTKKSKMKDNHIETQKITKNFYTGWFHCGYNDIRIKFCRMTGNYEIKEELYYEAQYEAVGG